MRDILILKVALYRLKDVMKMIQSGCTEFN